MRERFFLSVAIAILPAVVRAGEGRAFSELGVRAEISGVPSPAADVATLPGSRYEDVTVPLPAGVVVSDNRIRVLLPEGYHDVGNDRSYPVLYLLHGGGNDYRSWSEKTDLAGLTRGRDVITVMPDGGGIGEVGYYSDWADGSRQWERYHTETLVSFVDSRYRTLGDGHRAIAGLSLGGFGALKYAARHPGLYRAVAAFSPTADMTLLGPLSGLVRKLLPVSLVGTPEKVWGDQTRDAETWRDNSPLHLAPRLAGTLLWVSCGTGIVGGRYWRGSAKSLALGVWEWIHSVMTRAFIRRLQAARIPHTVKFYRGQHTWPYWQDALTRALPSLLDAVAPAKAR